jgi:hypothetical protein
MISKGVFDERDWEWSVTNRQNCRHRKSLDPRSEIGACANELNRCTPAFVRVLHPCRPALVDRLEIYVCGRAITKRQFRSPEYWSTCERITPIDIRYSWCLFPGVTAQLYLGSNLLEQPMKNVFGLNVIFSAFTSTPSVRESAESDSVFNPSPADVSQARMLRRTAKRTDRFDDVRKAS